MGSSLSLETLLQRYVATNDEDAMAELVARTRSRLLAAARRICPEEAEDAVQSAYLSLVRRRDAAVPVLPWLLTAVVRLSYRCRAKAQRLQALAERLAPRENVDCPVTMAIGREEEELLRFEVWRLPDTYRDALVLHYLQGLSLAETAQLLQLNSSTLRTRLQRGRRLLRSRVRILYPLLPVPWLLADFATAATVTLGGVMKAKGTLAAALILIASVIGGTAWLVTRDSDTARERAPRVAHDAADPTGPKPVTGQDQPAGGTADGDAPLERAEEEQPPFAAGVVVDAAGNPIEGARVLARVYRIDVARRRMPEQIGDAFRAADPLARTGEDGRFRVGSAPPGLHSLVFLRQGLAAKEVSCAENMKFDRTKGVTHADVKRPGVDLRVVLDHGRSLTGVVETTDGLPLPRALVRAFTRRGLTQQTRTDEQGGYAFHTLAQGISSMIATAGGFETERRTEVGGTADFRLRPRVLMLDVVDAVTRKLIPDARAMVVRDGRFVDTLHPGGSGLSGVDVSEWAVPGRIYALNNLVPDALGREKRLRIQVFVFAPGYLPWSDEVTLGHGETPPHLTVPLTPGDGPPAIAGHVRGSRSARVEVQYAYLVGRGGARPLLIAMDTEAKGRFSFSGLPAGKYILVARAEGRPEVVREVEAPVQDIFFDLRPGATLVVATKVADTMIHVETLDGGRFRRKRTNADGVATFEALAAGAYFVAAVIDGWDQSLKWRDSPRTDVTLESGKTSHIEVEVPRRQAVRFMVRDETGAPFSEVVLSLRPKRGIGSVVGNKEWNRLKGVAETNNDGRAEVDLFPGKYDAELKVGTTTLIVAVDVPAKGPVEALLPRGGITLKGTVRDGKTGRGLSGCWIYAYSVEERPKRLVDIKAGQSGEFEISGLSKPMMIIFRPMFEAMVGNARVKYAMGFLWLDGDRDEELDIRLPLSNLPKPVQLDIQAGAKARVRAYAWTGSCWIRVASAETDDSGRATLEAYDAPRYKVIVGKKEIEVEREGDRVAVTFD